VSERHIYSSSRLGTDVTTHEFFTTTYTVSSEANRELGQKHYEISNYLGNVLSVITDQKLPVEVDSLIVSYSAVVVTATDYSPFGVGLYGRSWSGEYRYGFNGKEKVNEVSETNANYDFGARMFESRLGRWYSTDACASKYAGDSPFQFAFNSPLAFVDPNGKDGRLTVNSTTHQITLETTVFLHGNLSNEEMQKLTIDFNSLYSGLQNTYQITDPADPSVVWTVTMKVNFDYDQHLNETLEDLGLNDSPVTANAMESIENKEAYGMMDGDNILKIVPGTKNGHTHMGGNEGQAGANFATAIHEVGHMLGFDERYMAKTRDANGDLVFSKYPFPVSCQIENFDLGQDFMSNGPLNNDIVKLSSFHFTDIVDYCVANGIEGNFLVGSCEDFDEVISRDSNGTRIDSKPMVYSHEHRFDDTDSGAGNVCSDIEEKQARVKN
jgi:RHS repeat-associated protein